MKVALGLKAHSGWAVLVGIGEAGGEQMVTDRRRLDLIETTAEWSKQPYHLAHRSPRAEARKIVERAERTARRLAARELLAAGERARRAGHRVAACVVLTTEALPGWSVEEILAVHFRVHRAEGVLFREALARAAEDCGLRLAAIPEKRLAEHAEATPGVAPGELREAIARLGKAVGPPWGRDQKDAALAALIALRGRGGGGPRRRRREAARAR